MQVSLERISKPNKFTSGALAGRIGTYREQLQMPTVIGELPEVDRVAARQRTGQGESACDAQENGG